MSFRPRRSALFLPASNPRAIEKARGLATDVVILDLEDAVAPEAKVGAREAAIAAAGQGFGTRETVIRVNGVDTEWGTADLAAMRGAGATVLVPKIRNAGDVRACRDHLGSETPLWVMIETCEALGRLQDIAEADVQGFVLGVNDLALELGIAEFIDMARSANVFFEIVNGRLTVRAVNPDWTMWGPIRHLLDEIGIERIDRFVRRTMH